MAWSNASLDGMDLPVQFRYNPYIPTKRNSIHPTHAAVITQTAPDQIVHGGEFLNWRIQAATPLEFKALWDKYKTTTPTAYTFIGYWGEEFEVYFTSFDSPTVQGRWFSLAGAFQVISVTTEYDPACGTL